MERFTNDAETTLAVTVDAIETSISAVSAADFPTGAQFRIRIDDELMLVTGVAGATWAVTRGIENTTAAIHLSDSQICHVLTAGALEQLKLDVFPTGSITGDMIRYNAGAWEVAEEPLVFKGIVLTPALASLVDAVGAIYFDSALKAVLVCTDI